MLNAEQPVVPHLREGWIESQPKADLHLHLLGALRPATALELAQQYSVTALPSHAEEWTGWFGCGNLELFVQRFLPLFELVQTADDILRLGRELAEDLAADGVCYAEPRVTATAHERRGMPSETLLEGLAQARIAAWQEHQVELAWVIDFPWLFGVQEGEHALAIARAGQNSGVVGLDVAGYEVSGCSTEGIGRLFEQAHEFGLGVTVHVGETVGPNHLRTVIEQWPVDRLGHAVALARYPKLMEQVARRGLTVECCPTSNIALGGVSDYRSHPLEKYRQAGIAVTINTDDPTLLNTRLSQELRRVAQAFGWSQQTMEEVIRTSWQSRFSSSSPSR